MGAGVAWATVMVIVCGAIVASVTGASGADPVYVAPTGEACSDGGPATASNPLCTLSAAAARVANTQGQVLLQPGVHCVVQTVLLDARHSNTSWGSAEGGRASVSGGVRLDPARWTPPTAGSATWTTQIPAEAAAARQIYINGVRATRTSGNASVLFGNMSKLTGNVTGYSVTNPAAKGWRHPEDMEFVYEMQIRPWTAPRCGVTAVSPDGLTISVEPLCMARLGTPSSKSNVRWFLSGLPSTIENAFELLTQPGTFYTDRTTLTLHYIPRPGEEFGTVSPSVVVPTLETLLVANGTDGLTLDGIDFEHTTWGGPDTTAGYTPIQAGWHQPPTGETAAEWAFARDGLPITQHGRLPEQRPARLASSQNRVAGNSNDGGIPQHTDLSRDARDALLPGQSLTSPAFLVAKSGNYFAIMEPNGEFCIKHGSGPTDPKATQVVWCSPISKGVGPFAARVQSDGNFCITDTAGGKNVWCASGVSQPFGSYFARIGDDGTWCIERGHYPVSNNTVACAPFSNSQSKMVPIPGGVRVVHSKRVTIRKAAFRRMGGAGLDVFGGSQHVTVTGCLVSDVSGSGIQVGGLESCPQCGASCTTCPNTITDATDFNITVVDTLVANATREFTGCLGVWAGYMRQFTLTHSEICHVEYGGVSVGWGWAIDVSKTYQRDNTLAYNRISNFLTKIPDSGGTYTLGPHPNSSIHHNWVTRGGSGVEPNADGQPGGVHGGAYYPDDGSAFWRIHDNVASEINLWLFAWNPNDQYNLTVVDNFADSPHYEMNAKNSTFQGNTYVPPTDFWPDAAAAIIIGSGIREANAHPDYSPEMCDTPFPPTNSTR